MANPVPTGLALVKAIDGSEQLLIADNYSDDVLLMDTATGKILRRFDLGEGSIVPSTYPIAVAVSRDQHYAYVALWNGSKVASLDLQSGAVGRTLPLLPPTVATAPSSHPHSACIQPGQKTLYVALSNRDAVAVVDVKGEKLRLAGTLDTRLPGQTFFGAIPSALAVSPDGKDLFVANSGSNAVAVFRTLTKLDKNEPARAAGFIPTGWFPTAVEVDGGKLYIATAKGNGTGPNVQPQHAPSSGAGAATRRLSRRPHTYIATLLYGSLASVDLDAAMRDLLPLTAATVKSNLMTAEQTHLHFASGSNPIKHVIYIIKENRTYDQILGDLGVGDGDKSLTMYGESITPEPAQTRPAIRRARQFLRLGRSVWRRARLVDSRHHQRTTPRRPGSSPTAAVSVCTTMKASWSGATRWPKAISDINEPGSGYLWTDLAKHGKSLYHFGEYVSTKFCDDSGEAPKEPSPLNGTPEPAPALCPHGYIKHGEAIPANYGGGVSPLSLEYPADFKKRRHQAGAGRQFRSTLSGFQPEVSGPTARGGVFDPLPWLGQRPQRRQGHDAVVHHAAAAE